MKFRYKKLSTGHVRPIIPVTIKTKSNEVDFFALVDSGSDTCLFPGELGEFLGIDVEAGTLEQVGGVIEGQRRSCYIHRVTICVGGWEYKVKVRFMPDLSRNGYGILGQHGFFDQFTHVKFQKPKDVVEIKQ